MHEEKSGEYKESSLGGVVEMNLKNIHRFFTL